ncbi:MAG: HlyD family efflux transporter periplasmic adaptor subunit [Cohaesibacter sp.]|jgi:HlyD family secretion protein|nr:HlyD family efflux transporter periplasmic adaptor subunit [Cohaesibacter sp.]
MAKRKSRHFLSFATLALVGAAVAWSFWPRPLMVDLGEVRYEPMIVTINEEGRTRVHDAYVVSTPVAGRLLRVEVEPGDAVVKGESVVAQMLPTNPAALDIRTREQARAAVTAAEASLRVAKADLNKAIADLDLSQSELKRATSLAKRGTISTVALERSQRDARRASAVKDTAEAAIAMREAELANARARLIDFDSPQGFASAGKAQKEIPLYSPVTGRILKVIQQSETTLAAGAPVMEIGNIAGDLEIVVEFLSSDAVQISKGDRVIIDDWGGDAALSGIVERIDPLGFTKFSALGVEEQRVNGVIRFTDDQNLRAALGHGFRVEAQVVIWEDAKALVVPSNALFRDGQDWAVFTVSEGKARLTHVKVGQNNGLKAQILDGLSEGEQIILYPAAGILDGKLVEQR